MTCCSSERLVSIPTLFIHYFFESFPNYGKRSAATKSKEGRESGGRPKHQEEHHPCEQPLSDGGNATNGKGRSDGSRKEGKDNNGFIADWGSRKTTGYHLYVLGRISGQSCLVV